MVLKFSRPALSLFSACVLFSGCASSSPNEASVKETRSAATIASSPTGAAGSSKTTAPRTRDLEASVEALLNGYERVPDAEDWKALGPQAYTVLDRLIASPDTLPSVKSRAISSLALVQNPEALPRLEGLVQDGSLTPHLRAKAVLALASRAGQPAQPLIAPLLENPAVQVREAAAQALGRFGSPTSRKALETRLAKEKDVAVREAIESGLSRTR